MSPAYQSGERVDLDGCELAAFARREVAERDRPDGDPHEAPHAVADRAEEPSDLAVHALRERDAIARAAARCLAEPLDADRAEDAAVEARSARAKR
jgi:hypothetical protein